MDAVQIGPFYVNWRLFVLFISVAAGFGIVLLRTRRSMGRTTSLSDILFNAILIGFAGWKLSPFLFQPSLIWQQPLKGLLTIGGLFEGAVGIVLAISYLIGSMLKHGLPLKLLADALGYGAAGFMIVRSIMGGWRYGKGTELPWGIQLRDPNFHYHPINVYEGLLAAGLLLIFFVSKMKLGDGRAGQVLFVYGGAGWFAISLFSNGEAIFEFFTGLQWMGLVMILIGLLLPRMYILWEGYQERSGKVMVQGDSRAQERRERKNEQSGKKTSPEQSSFDKKLDGPNRPAE